MCSLYRHHYRGILCQKGESLPLRHGSTAGFHPLLLLHHQLGLLGHRRLILRQYSRPSDHRSHDRDHNCPHDIRICLQGELCPLDRDLVSLLCWRVYLRDCVDLCVHAVAIRVAVRARTSDLRYLPSDNHKDDYRQ